jgi:hypothetical protein
MGAVLVVNASPTQVRETLDAGEAPHSEHAATDASLQRLK